MKQKWGDFKCLGSRLACPGGFDRCWEALPWPETRPVCVELFKTSPGFLVPAARKCFLHELSKRDDVIALALHWILGLYSAGKTAFAKPARPYIAQKAYAKAGGSAVHPNTPQLNHRRSGSCRGHPEENAAALIPAHAANRYRAPIGKAKREQRRAYNGARASAGGCGRAVGRLCGCDMHRVRQSRSKRGEKCG